MTWPLARRLGTHIPADQGSDFWVHEWTFWWLKQALLEQQNPYFTPYLYHPSGVSLTSHNIAWVNFGVWFPLQAAFGPTTAYSLAFLLLFPFNGFAMYLFAFVRLRARAAAFVAGLVFAFWPYVLSQYGHPNMLTLGWLPLAALYWTRISRGGTVRDAVMLGLFLALLGVSRWQLLVPAAYVLMLLAAADLLGQRTRHTAGRSVLLGSLGAGVAALLMAPWLIPIAAAQVTRPFADSLLIYEPAFSTDVTSYFVPSANLRHWSWLTHRLPAPLQFSGEEITFLGYTALLLSAVSLAVYRRRALLWLVMALVLMLLAAGPVLTVAGHQVAALPAPYHFVEEWFVNRLMRKPERFNIFLGLPLGMLAGLGVHAITAQRSRRSVQLATAALTAVFLLEYAVNPYPLARTDVPNWYAQLADEPDDFAVAAFPIGSRLADKFYMHDQTVHGKPILGGHVSRPPRESIAFMDASPMLDDMLFRREMDPARVDVGNQLRHLADAGFRFLVLDKRQATAAQLDAWRDWLTIIPRHEDDDVVVYTTTPQEGLDYTVAAQLTNSIGVIRAQISTDQAEQGGLVTVDVRWAGRDGAPRYDACLRLRNTNDEVLQVHCYAISPDWPTDRWQQSEVARGQYVLRVHPHLPPGDYRAEITVQDVASAQTAPESLELGPLAVAGLAREFAPPQPDNPTNIRLGDDVVLLGYDLSFEETLRITLYWQALRRMERAYKVFVHVTDTASGAMAAQHDAAPRNWQYPTTWWETNEVVAETIEVTLPADLVPARVQVRVGMYDEETGARLPLQGAEQKIGDDDAIVLTPP